MISLLINSWKRIDNIKRIIDYQKNYKLINEILIFNNNPEVKVEHSHHKVKIINSNIDFGLRTRWVNGILARNDCLVFQDDDLVAEESAFEKMWGLFNDDPERIYCAWGRNPNPDQSYSMKNCSGEVEIALTCLACVPKEIIPFVIAAEKMFFEHNDLDYSVLNKWGYHGDMNGEDIFLSYCSSSFYRQRPLQVQLPVKHLPSNDALHKRSGHIQARTNMISRCKEFFGNDVDSQKKMEKYLQNLGNYGQ